MFSSIIIEGCDRLGKGTLIEGLLQRLGYFQVIHYEKPKLLDRYLTGPILHQQERSREALKQYQLESFTTMLRMLSSEAKLILDRAHLGEFVYAPRYRKYDGTYVFELERHFKSIGSKFDERTLLILLHTSDWNFISDDGKSFDVTQREEEQNDFYRAFDRSLITHKVLLDVHDGSGAFVSPQKILEIAVEAFNRIQQHQMPVLNVRWKHENGEIQRIAEQQPDPKKFIK